MHDPIDLGGGGLVNYRDIHVQEHVPGVNFIVNIFHVSKVSL